ncbi:MAG: hypothetical protein M1504_02660 [Candidatus Marsarchaeota archaeon]|nr:hypothetical protein [Candidatus Marsarchaeota archaeon]
MPTKSTYFCETHHMLKGRIVTIDGVTEKVCTLCYRELVAKGVIVEKKTTHPNGYTKSVPYGELEALLKKDPTIPNRKAAHMLGIDERTVKAHRTVPSRGSEKISLEDEIQILKLRITDPNITVYKISQIVEHTRGTVSRVLSNPSTEAEAALKNVNTPDKKAQK